MYGLMTDPKTVILAILSGIIPAIFWLIFWLRQEDRDEPEPIGLIVITFIIGAATVFLAIWLERYSLNFIKDNNNLQIIVWAGIEEILKLIGVMIIIYGNKNVNMPIDLSNVFHRLCPRFCRT
jgi:RsiW-degrading membrane proteinase PrsW (M82 family)